MLLPICSHSRWVWSEKLKTSFNQEFLKKKKKKNPKNPKTQTKKQNKKTTKNKNPTKLPRFSLAVYLNHLWQYQKRYLCRCRREIWGGNVRASSKATALLSCPIPEVMHAMPHLWDSQTPQPWAQGRAWWEHLQHHQSCALHGPRPRNHRAMARAATSTFPCSRDGWLELPGAEVQSSQPHQPCSESVPQHYGWA